MAIGVLLPNDVLMDVGYALVEQVVSTQLSTGFVVIGPGVVATQPQSMAGIVTGGRYVVDQGVGTQEEITVLSTTSSSFTANYISPHQPTAIVMGCAFPQNGNPIWTQSEMLSYLFEAHVDFCQLVRPIYNLANVAVSLGGGVNGTAVYPAPADSIRIERASIVQPGVTAYELWDTTQSDLDWENSLWPTQTSALRAWYQDQILFQSIGFSPPPQSALNVRLIYSQKVLTVPNLTTPFIIPDPMVMALKWRMLALALSKDGEQRDPERAKFCQAMYEMLVMVSKKFMEGVMARVRSDEESVEPLASTRF
jgi:hypothetical protein